MWVVIDLERERRFTTRDNRNRVAHNTTDERRKIKVLTNPSHKRGVWHNARRRKRREISPSPYTKLLGAVREPVNIVICVADDDESGGLVI
jgi:hypothetical protein